MRKTEKALDTQGIVVVPPISGFHTNEGTKD